MNAISPISQYDSAHLVDAMNRKEEDNRRAIHSLMPQENFLSIFHNTVDIYAKASKIFAIENRFREVLGKDDFPEKIEYQILYNETIIPLVQQAKLSIINSPIHNAVKAAAEKGKAAQAGIRALKNSIQNNPVIEVNIRSVQEVFLFPEYGAVIKKFAHEFSAEEEDLINCLFDLMSKQAVVGTYRISKPALTRYGVKISLEDKERGFSWHDPMPPQVRFAICALLPFHLSKGLQYPKSTLKMDDPEKVNYLLLEKERWMIQIPGKMVENIGLKELQTLYLKELLPPDTVIESSNTLPMSLEEHIFNESPLYKALNYFPTLNSSTASTFLAPDFTTQEEEIAYKICDQYSWQYIDENGLCQHVNFQNFHLNNLENRQMSFVNFFPIGFPPYFPSQEQIQLALGVPLMEMQLSEIYLAPDLTEPNHKEAYEACEKCNWTYTDAFGIAHIVDFKTLHANILEQKPMWYLGVAPNENLNSLPHPTQVQLNTAVTTPWKILSEEIIGIKTRLNQQGLIESIVPLNLNNIQAKPFIEDMILLSQLGVKDRNAVLHKLTDDAQFNAILTAELQLLDLHANNLGVQPEPNPEYDYYSQIEFTFPPHNKSITFKDVLKDHLANQIGPHTVIQFEEEGIIISKELKDLPKLQKALDIKWNLVIFDTDCSLSEGNELQYIYRANVKKHLIPLRSVLLETSSKDHPLSQDVIQRLMNSEERDIRVQHWIRNEDAPIYKQLPGSVRVNIQQQVMQFAENYHVSDFRKREGITSLKIVKTKFAKDISKISQPHLLEMWKTLQQYLPHSGDLTSNSVESLKKRKKIALKLFPRMTVRQQEALIERQQNRKIYLMRYQTLSQSILQGEALTSQIQEYLQDPTTPLTSRRRKDLLDQLAQQKSHFLNDPQALTVFKTMISTECQPTYFNLAKAIYPFLADVYELDQAAYNVVEAGSSIGFSHQPIEDAIKKVKAKFALNSPQVLLAQNLENKIGSMQNTPFFGYRL